MFVGIFRRQTMYAYRLLFILLLPFLSVLAGSASVNAPSVFVRNYTVHDYTASCQNWDIAVSYTGILYAANNSGLLTFDGNTWRIYPLPDGSMLTHVTFRNDTVYSRGIRSQGFWLQNETGGMDYHPLEALPSDAMFAHPEPGYPLPEEVNRAYPTAFATAGKLHFTGTAADGLFISDDTGRLLLHLSTQNQLQDNIVRDICVQDERLVWVAFDNGIAQIDIDPPIRMLGRRAVIGKLEKAMLRQDTLYIRTNSGYFVRTLRPDDEFAALSEERGWTVMGNVDKTDVFSEDFPTTGSWIEQEAWRNAMADGTHRLEMAEIFPDKASLGMFAAAEESYPAAGGRYWLTAANEAGLFEKAGETGVLKCRILFDNYDLNLVTSGKRVISLNDSLDLVSTMQGTLLIDTRRLIAEGLGGLTMPQFRRIEYVGRDTTHRFTEGAEEIVLPHSFRELIVSVGTTVFTPNHQISYCLEGVSAGWSPWQKDGKISFLQLPEGEYELKVRKYVVKGPYPEISLPIRVRPPWYNTVWAYAAYILLAWLGGQELLRLYLRNMRREEQRRQEEERQEEEKRLQRMRSEMLEAELQNKTNELTLQTSALVKRNQAIRSFLDELEKQKETLGDRYPNKLYAKLKTLMEEALNDQADWLQFETYFNSAHQNFMERLRQRYADITTGDLRICCLLRMNLSTKEIASLMNVSVRAVELRRYRLRKRLSLDGETNLVDFLMNF